MIIPLREDLKLLPGSLGPGGSPTWKLYDPVRNRFWMIGWPEFEILSRWGQGNAEDIALAVSTETLIKTDADEVLDIQQLLSVNGLLKKSHHLRSENKLNILKWLLHNYLYIKIHLFNPDRFLSKSLRFAKCLTHPFSILVFMLLGVFGIFSVLTRWVEYKHTFIYLFSIKGLFYYGLSTIIAKLLHEFGHAYTAKNYGLNVPSMGIVFLVMWPVFYTDNTDAWKLRDNKSRLMIAVSGVFAEMYLAVLATVGWALCQDGPVRSAFFLISSTIWVRSFFLNLSPFMRFDGYYIVSDLLDMPNFQTRSFAIGKWFLRKVLLGINTPCPESMSLRKTVFVILYAITTWIYRLVVFIGIAFLVYRFSFKALGIFLFFVEITWFIAKPVYSEIRVWLQIRKQIKRNRLLLFFAVLGVVQFVFFVPWDKNIKIPAVMRSATISKIYPHGSAQIKEVKISVGQEIKKGDTLFILEDNLLDYEMKIATYELEMLNKKYTQISNSENYFDKYQVAQKELVAALERVEGYREQIQQLTIKANDTGIVKEITRGIRPGLWVSRKNLLAVLLDENNNKVKAYINEEYISLIKKGMPAKFYEESGLNSPVECLVSEVRGIGTSKFDELCLASVHGGDIPVLRNVDGILKTNESFYQICLDPAITDNNSACIPRLMKGNVIVKVNSVPLAFRMFENIFSWGIKESNF